MEAERRGKQRRTEDGSELAEDEGEEEGELEDGMCNA